MRRDLVDEYCSYHHELNKISQQRAVAQRRVLRELELTLPGPLDLVCAVDLERYMLQLTRDGYHPHTIVNRLNSLIKPFLRWMWRQRLIDAERWLQIMDVKAPRGAYDGLPRPYNPQEIRQFWLEFEKKYPWTRDERLDLRTPARGEHWVRRWARGLSPWARVYPYARRLQAEAIVSLALYGGLRRDEIFNIELGDMSYESEYVRVVSRKGAEAHEKVRVVPMNEPLRVAIGNWIEFRAQVLAPPHERPWLCLWYRRGATPTVAMSHWQFEGTVARIGRGWEFHRLRHTFGTQRYRADMPLEILQQVLGHSRISQTLGYAEISDDTIIAASRKSDAKFMRAVQRDRKPNQPESR